MEFENGLWYCNANHRKFETRAQAKLEIFDYIEVWYNRKRRHSALGYQTPVQAEKEMMKNKIQAA